MTGLTSGDVLQQLSKTALSAKDRLMSKVSLDRSIKTTTPEAKELPPEQAMENMLKRLENYKGDHYSVVQTVGSKLDAGLQSYVTKFRDAQKKNSALTFDDFCRRELGDGTIVFNGYGSRVKMFGLEETYGATDIMGNKVQPRALKYDENLSLPNGVISAIVGKGSVDLKKDGSTRKLTFWRDDKYNRGSINNDTTTERSSAPIDGQDNEKTAGAEVVVDTETKMPFPGEDHNDYRRRTLTGGLGHTDVGIRLDTKVIKAVVQQRLAK